MRADVFTYAHARTGETVGIAARSTRGTVDLVVVSRDTILLDVAERGRLAVQRSLSRRGAALMSVLASIAGERAACGRVALASRLEAVAGPSGGGLSRG